MYLKKQLWQMMVIIALFFICKFDSIAGQSGNKVRSKDSLRRNFQWAWACDDEEFKCTRYGPCIGKKLLCNGFSDCPLGNDEQKETCDINECPAEKFRCSSGTCIDKKYLCDGIKHCVFDADDEKNAVCKNRTCPATKYQCPTGACIDKSLLCDGFANCLDGDDENTDTCENFKCPEGKFRCSSGACVDKKYVCDGVVHCMFGTFDDESPELCKNKRKCPLEKYQCVNGDCLDAENVCDTYEDCSAEDETTGNCAMFFKKQSQLNESCFLPSESTHQTFAIDCLNTDDCSHQASGQVPVFTQVTVRCQAGYQFRYGSTSVSSCFRGTWRPPIQKCYRSCPPIKNPDLDLTCFDKLKGIPISCDDAMLVGAIVYPKCKEYYHQNRETDYSYIRCLPNGQWDRQLFKCVADCGRPPPNTIGLITGGKPEQRGDSPWNVAIYDLSNPNEPALICGGTIIAPQLVVSAAHCFFNYDEKTLYSASLFEVVVSKYAADYAVKDNSETKGYKIRKIFTPEILPFETTNYIGDIALLWTSEKMKFSSGVLPACVEWTHTTRFIVPDGTEGKLVGWGVTENGTTSDVLLTALLPYVNYKNCRDMVSDNFNIGADKFCAGTKQVLGVGARPGDSGGGLFFRKVNSHGNLYYLRGIVSNKDGTTGAKQTSLAAFTDVAQYATWMYEKLIKIENDELLAETKVGLKS